MLETALKSLSPTEYRMVKRLLTRLRAGGRVHVAEAGLCHVIAGNGALRKPSMKVPEELIAKLRRKELLDPVPGNGGGASCHYQLSNVGLMFLRRMEAVQESAFSAQHRIEETRFIPSRGHANDRYRVNAGESPLGWLRRRKDSSGRPLISEIQYDAGETLRTDYALARLNPRVSTNWDNLAVGRNQQQRNGGEMFELTDAALKARERVHIALKEVGPSLSDILLHTCCYLDGLEEAERKLGWPRRSGKLVLQIALDRLVEHYGLRPRDQRGRAL